MRILYLVGGKYIYGGGATTRDAIFVRGLRNIGHEVDAVSIFGPTRVDGAEEEASLFHPLGHGTLRRYFPKLSKVPGALAGLVRRPRPVRNLTSFAVGGYVDHAGPEAVNTLSGRDKRQRNEFIRLMDHVNQQAAKPDVIVLSNIMLSGLAEPLAANLGCDIVCLSQGSDRLIEAIEEPFRSDARKLVRKNARLFRQVISTSRSFAIRATEFMAVPTKKVKVVPPGVDTDFFTNAKPRQRHPFIIGCMGEIHDRRGLDILVDAMDSLVKDTRVEPELWIAGRVVDSRYWQRIKRRLESPLLRGKYKFFGPLNNSSRRDFLSGLSVFAIASREPESKGTIILEAMAMGIPVVGPSSGIIPEIFQFANCGLLVSSETPVWMYAQAFELLATIPETADQMGKNAAAGVAEHFSVLSAAGRLATLLAEAAGEQTEALNPGQTGAE